MEGVNCESTFVSVVYYLDVDCTTSKTLCHSTMSLLNANNNSKVTKVETTATCEKRGAGGRWLAGTAKGVTFTDYSKNHRQGRANFRSYLQKRGRLKMHLNAQKPSWLHRYVHVKTALMRHDRNPEQSFSRTCLTGESGECVKVFEENGEEIRRQSWCEDRVKKCAFSSWFWYAMPTIANPVHYGNVTNNSNHTASWPSSSTRQTTAKKKSVDMFKGHPNLSRGTGRAPWPNNADYKTLASRREQRKNRSRPWRELLSNATNDDHHVEEGDMNDENRNKGLGEPRKKIGNSIPSASDNEPEVKLEPGGVRENTFSMGVKTENSQCKSSVNKCNDSSVCSRFQEPDSDIKISQNQMHQRDVAVNYSSCAFVKGKMVEHKKKERLKEGYLKKPSCPPSRIPMRRFPVTKDTQTDEPLESLSCSWKSPCDFQSLPSEDEKMFTECLDVTDKLVEDNESSSWVNPGDPSNQRTVLLQHTKAGFKSPRLRYRQQIAKKVQAMVESYARFLEREGVMKGLLSENKVTLNDNHDHHHYHHQHQNHDHHHHEGCIEESIALEKIGAVCPRCLDQLTHNAEKCALMMEQHCTENDPVDVTPSSRGFVELKPSIYPKMSASKSLAETTTSDMRRHSSPTPSCSRVCDDLTETPPPPPPPAAPPIPKSQSANLHSRCPNQSDLFCAQSRRQNLSKSRGNKGKEVSSPSPQARIKRIIPHQDKAPLTACSRRNLPNMCERNIKLRNAQNQGDMVNADRQISYPKNKPTVKERKSLSERQTLPTVRQAVHMGLNKIRDQKPTGSPRGPEENNSSHALASKPNKALSDGLKRDGRKQGVHNIAVKIPKQLRSTMAPPKSNSSDPSLERNTERFSPKRNLKAVLTTKHVTKPAHAKAHASLSEQGFGEKQQGQAGDGHGHGHGHLMSRFAHGDARIKTSNNASKPHVGLFDPKQFFSTGAASLCSEKDSLAMPPIFESISQQGVNVSEENPDDVHSTFNSGRTLRRNSNQSPETNRPKHTRTYLTSSPSPQSIAVSEKDEPHSFDTLTSSWKSGETSSFSDKLPDGGSSQNGRRRERVLCCVWPQDDKGSVATSSGECRHSSTALTSGCVETSKSTMKGISDLTYTSAESLLRDSYSTVDQRRDLESMAVMSDPALVRHREVEVVVLDEARKDCYIRRSLSDFCVMTNRFRSSKTYQSHQDPITSRSSDNSYLSFVYFDYEDRDRQPFRNETRNATILRSDQIVNKWVHFKKHATKCIRGTSPGGLAQQEKNVNRRDPLKQTKIMSGQPYKIRTVSCHSPINPVSPEEKPDAYFSLKSTSTQMTPTGKVAATQDSPQNSHSGFRKLRQFWENRFTSTMMKSAPVGERKDVIGDNKNSDVQIDKDKPSSENGADSVSEQFLMQDLVEERPDSGQYQPLGSRKSSHSDRNSSASPSNVYGIPMSKKNPSLQKAKSYGHHGPLMLFSPSKRAGRLATLAMFSNTMANDISQVPNKNKSLRTPRDHAFLAGAVSVFPTGQALKYDGRTPTSRIAKRRMQRRSNIARCGSVQAQASKQSNIARCGSVQAQASKQHFVMSTSHLHDSVMTPLMQKQVQCQNAGRGEQEVDLGAAKNSPERQEMPRAINSSNKDNGVKVTCQVAACIKKKDTVSKMKLQSLKAEPRQWKSTPESPVSLEVLNQTKDSSDISGLKGTTKQTVCLPVQCVVNSSTKYQEQYTFRSAKHEKVSLEHPECNLIDRVSTANIPQERNSIQTPENAHMGQQPPIQKRIPNVRDVQTKDNTTENPRVQATFSKPISTGSVRGGQNVEREIYSNGNATTGNCYSEYERHPPVSTKYAVKQKSSSNEVVVVASETRSRKPPDASHRSGKTKKQAHAKNCQWSMLRLGESPSDKTDLSKQLSDKCLSDVATLESESLEDPTRRIADTTRHCFVSSDTTCGLSCSTGMEMTQETKMAHQVVKPDKTPVKSGSIVLSTTPHRSAKSEFSTKLCSRESTPQVQRLTRGDLNVGKDIARTAVRQRECHDTKPTIIVVTTTATDESDTDHKDAKEKKKKKKKKSKKSKNKGNAIRSPCQRSSLAERASAPENLEVGTNQSRLSAYPPAPTRKGVNTDAQKSGARVHANALSSQACKSGQFEKKIRSVSPSPSATTNTHEPHVQQNTQMSRRLLPSGVGLQMKTSSSDKVTVTSNESKTDNNYIHPRSDKPVPKLKCHSNQRKMPRHVYRESTNKHETSIRFPKISFQNESQKLQASKSEKVHEVEIVIGKDIPVQSFVDCFINGLTGNPGHSVGQNGNEDSKKCPLIGHEKTTELQLNTSASNMAGYQGCAGRPNGDSHVIQNVNDSGCSTHRIQVPFAKHPMADNLMRCRRRSVLRRAMKQKKSCTKQCNDWNDSSDCEETDNNQGNRTKYRSRSLPTETAGFKREEGASRRSREEKIDSSRAKERNQVQGMAVNDPHCSRLSLGPCRSPEDIRPHRDLFSRRNNRELDREFSSRRRRDIKSVGRKGIRASQTSDISDYSKQSKESCQHIQVFAPCCFPTTGKSVKVQVSKNQGYKQVKLSLTDNITGKESRVIVEPKTRQASLSPKVETKFGFVHVNFYSKSQTEADGISGSTSHNLRSRLQLRDRSLEQEFERQSFGGHSNADDVGSKNLTLGANSDLLPLKCGNTREYRTRRPARFSYSFDADYSNVNRGYTQRLNPVRNTRSGVPSRGVRKHEFSERFRNGREALKEWEEEKSKTVENIRMSNPRITGLQHYTKNISHVTSKNYAEPPAFRPETPEKSPCEMLVPSCFRSLMTTRINGQSQPRMTDKCTEIAPRTSDKCSGLSPYRRERYTDISPCKPKKRRPEEMKFFTATTRSNPTLSSGRQQECPQGGSWDRRVESTLVGSSPKSETPVTLSQSSPIKETRRPRTQDACTSPPRTRSLSPTSNGKTVRFKNKPRWCSLDHDVRFQTYAPRFNDNGTNTDKLTAADSRTYIDNGSISTPPKPMMQSRRFHNEQQPACGCDPNRSTKRASSSREEIDRSSQKRQTFKTLQKSMPRFDDYGTNFELTAADSRTYSDNGNIPTPPKPVMQSRLFHNEQQPACGCDLNRSTKRTPSNKEEIDRSSQKRQKPTPRSDDYGTNFELTAADSRTYSDNGNIPTPPKSRRFHNEQQPACGCDPNPSTKRTPSNKEEICRSCQKHQTRQTPAPRFDNHGPNADELTTSGSQSLGTNGNSPTPSVSDTQSSFSQTEQQPKCGCNTNRFTKRASSSWEEIKGSSQTSCRCQTEGKASTRHRQDETTPPTPKLRDSGKRARCEVCPQVETNYCKQYRHVGRTQELRAANRVHKICSHASKGSCTQPSQRCSHIIARCSCANSTKLDKGRRSTQTPQNQQSYSGTVDSVFGSQSSKDDILNEAYEEEDFQDGDGFEREIDSQGTSENIRTAHLNVDARANQSKDDHLLPSVKSNPICPQDTYLDRTSKPSRLAGGTLGNGKSNQPCLDYEHGRATVCGTCGSHLNFRAKGRGQQVCKGARHSVEAQTPDKAGSSKKLIHRGKLLEIRGSDMHPPGTCQVPQYLDGNQTVIQQENDGIVCHPLPLSSYNEGTCLPETYRQSQYNDGPRQLETYRKSQYNNGPGQPETYRESQFNDGPRQPVTCHESQFNDGPRQPVTYRESQFNDGPGQPETYHESQFNDGPRQPVTYCESQFNDGPRQPEMYRESQYNDGPRQPEMYRESQYNDGPRQPEMYRESQFNDGPRKPETYHESQCNDGPRQPETYRESQYNDGPRQPETYRESQYNDGPRKPVAYCESQFNDGTRQPVTYRESQFNDGPRQPVTYRESQFNDGPRQPVTYRESQCNDIPRQPVTYRESQFNDGPRKPVVYCESQFNDGPRKPVVYCESQFNDGPRQPETYQNIQYNDGPRQPETYKKFQYNDGPRQPETYRESQYNDGPRQPETYRKSQYNNGPRQPETYQKCQYNDGPRQPETYQKCLYNDGPRQPETYQKPQYNDGPRQPEASRKSQYNDSPRQSKTCQKSQYNDGPRQLETCRRSQYNDNPRQPNTCRNSQCNDGPRQPETYKKFQYNDGPRNTKMYRKHQCNYDPRQTKKYRKHRNKDDTRQLQMYHESQCNGDPYQPETYREFHYNEYPCQPETYRESLDNDEYQTGILQERDGMTYPPASPPAYIDETCLPEEESEYDDEDVGSQRELDDLVFESPPRQPRISDAYQSEMCQQLQYADEYQTEIQQENDAMAYQAVSEQELCYAADSPYHQQEAYEESTCSDDYQSDICQEECDDCLYPDGPLANSQMYKKNPRRRLTADRRCNEEETMVRPTRKNRLTTGNTVDRRWYEEESMLRPKMTKNRVTSAESTADRQSLFQNVGRVGDDVCNDEAYSWKRRPTEQRPIAKSVRRSPISRRSRRKDVCVQQDHYRNTLSRLDQSNTQRILRLATASPDSNSRMGKTIPTLVNEATFENDEIGSFHSATSCEVFKQQPSFYASSNKQKENPNQSISKIRPSQSYLRWGKSRRKPLARFAECPPQSISTQRQSISKGRLSQSNLRHDVPHTTAKCSQSRTGSMPKLYQTGLTECEQLPASRSLDGFTKRHNSQTGSRCGRSQTGDIPRSTPRKSMSGKSPRKPFSRKALIESLNRKESQQFVSQNGPIQSSSKVVSPEREVNPQSLPSPCRDHCLPKAWQSQFYPSVKANLNRSESGFHTSEPTRYPFEPDVMNYRYCAKPTPFNNSIPSLMPHSPAPPVSSSRQSTAMKTTTPPTGPEDSGYETSERNIRFRIRNKGPWPGFSPGERHVKFIDRDDVGGDCGPEEGQSNIQLTIRGPGTLTQKQSSGSPKRKDQRPDKSIWSEGLHMEENEEEGVTEEEVEEEEEAAEEREGEIGIDDDLAYQQDIQALSQSFSDWDRSIMENVRKRIVAVSTGYGQ